MGYDGKRHPEKHDFELLGGLMEEAGKHGVYLYEKLEEYFDAGIVDENMSHTVYHATLHGQVRLLKLLENKFELVSSYPKPFKIIEAAAASGNLRALEYVCRCTPDFDESDEISAMEGAAKQGDEKILSYILEHYPSAICSLIYVPAARYGKKQSCDGVPHQDPSSNVLDTIELARIGYLEILKWAVENNSPP